jgi:hypothetical protein
MLATITLDRRETFQLSRTCTGETIITIPLEVLKRAYCDYVAAQVRSKALEFEGIPLQ